MAGDLFVGIMSGTSLDGVDAALCRFSQRPGNTALEILGEASISWPEELRSTLYRLATEESVRMDDLVRTHFLLPHYYAEATLQAIKTAGFQPEDVTAIGLHGQTVRHLPVLQPIADGTPAVAGTLQIGSGPALAALTSIDVVSDFRSADMALGGQGAPLVPMFDNVFLRSPSIDRVALNIGGIANLTWLPHDALGNVVAFDCGPGNMIIDSLTRRYFERPFDRDGSIASSGEVERSLLDELLSHKYFRTPPPKSTGRELFGDAFLDRFVERVESKQLAPKDAVATATEFTARSIADAIRTLSALPVEVLVSGGGAKNGFLLSRLRSLLPHAGVVTTDTVGIPVQSKEAAAFAFFAYAFVKGQHIHLPSTTGAKRAIILGSLSRGK